MGQLLAFEKQLNPNTSSRGITTHCKEESKHKRSSPMIEEPDIVSKSFKSDCNISNCDEMKTHPSPSRSKPDNRRTVDFCSNSSRCTMDARRNGLKLLLKSNCASVVPNTV